MTEQAMNQGRMNQKQLMRWIMMLGLCQDDMELYLDTHQDDAKALAYYNQCLELLNEAKRAYEEEYGPLTTEPDQPLENWDWTKTPWPWEGGYR